MKKLYYLIVIVLISGLVLTGCSLLSNISQVPTTGQSGITYLTKHTEGDPQKIDLLAGQTLNVGEVKVWNDTENLYVKYVIDDTDWCLTETHLHVATSIGDIPQTKKGNPKPGQFEYKEKHDCELEFLYTIPLTWVPETELFIATHAVVKKETITFDTCMIDFEEFSEYDDVSSVSTDCGEVTFWMVDYTPLIGLSIDDIATLTVKVDLPVIAEENTMSADYYGLVAFTSNSNGMKDDLVLDDSGTGAGGKMLTDALDYSQTSLLYHAYTKYQAILVNVSNVLNIDTLNFVGIDLDHNELWHFQYFDENDVLIADVTVGPGTTAGDGKAYQTNFTDPRISKVAIWGEQNQEVPDRLGFAIDNIEITTKTVTVQEETAWGAGFDFSGKNWATYFTYKVQLPQDGMVLWLDAGKGITKSEELVSNWEDQSGIGNDATADAPYQPTWVENVSEINDNPVVRFTGDEKYLRHSPILTGDYTAFYVLTLTESEGKLLYYYHAGNVNAGDLGFFAENDNKDEGWGSVGNAGTPSVAVRTSDVFPTPDDWRIHTHQPETLYKNGEDVFDYRREDDVYAGNLTDIGSRSDHATLHFVGDIAEILVYDRILTVSEREMVEDYLNAKYSIY